MVMAAAGLISLAAGLVSAVLMSLISEKLTTASAIDTAFILYFVGIVLLMGLLNLWAKWLIIHKLTARVAEDLHLRLACQILSAPLRQLEKTGASRLLAILTDDVGNIITAMTSIPTLCINSAIVLGCAAYLAWLSPLAFAYFALLGIPAYLGYQVLNRRAKKALTTVIQARDLRYNHFSALTEGNKELKINSKRRSAFYLDHLKPAEQLMRKKGAEYQFLQESANTWSQTIYFFFILVLFFMTAAGQANLQVLTGFALVALYTKGAVMSALNVLPIWNRASMSMESIEQSGFPLEGEMTEPQALDKTAATSSPLVELELKEVTHTYHRELDNGRFTLGPISLKFKSGELVFLTGGNGSGKTTLIKVLTALYTPESGSILVNGKALTPDDLESYYQYFSIIFSDAYLFEVLLGMDQDKLDSRARQYLVDLQLQHKVQIEDGRLSTIQLSEGQRKRLALLTAYLEDRPVYIFDEWAAGQDPAFKEIFYRRILPDLQARNKLIIAISHDDHYFNAAGRIIKLDEGQLESDIRRDQPA